MADDEEFMREVLRHLIGLISALTRRFWGRSVSHEQFMRMVRGG